MNKKYTINAPRGFTLTANSKFSPPDDEVEQDARVIFLILSSKLQGKVTDRALELYKIWYEYTELPDTPISNFGAEKFLEVLDRGEVDLDGNSN